MFYGFSSVPHSYTWGLYHIYTKAKYRKKIKFSIQSYFDRFVFAGWLILGPYHFKFKSIMSTSECLFSLINGDDMFATFSSIPMEKTVSVWVYSRIYLYFFISVFIYVILSLFISIIMDTYELIKTCYERGFPCTRYK